MRHLPLGLFLLAAACSPTRAVVVPDDRYAASDYLKTAWEALRSAETDTGGHRIRAQLATRAALEALGGLRDTQLVPYQGPPTLAVALELLERSEPRLHDNLLAQRHARSALAELRAALR